MSKKSSLTFTSTEVHRVANKIAQQSPMPTSFSPTCTASLQKECNHAHTSRWPFLHAQYQDAPVFLHSAARTQCTDLRVSPSPIHQTLSEPFNLQDAQLCTVL